MPAVARARLLALRLQGFKSFAERTLVEFGPGISAVVGPNGSGKSNLADALRWAMGEQGRALRSRKSEDVIFAGSERRAALGMADVTLSLDNGDGLLPVEYEVLELGRRLYRSGENDYLLNKQRVRLRDLVDLLDGANLADNAFLFIGQGMVDQALALRPEERRPLFEEVAGVRRHERRRRKAEEQLTESDANLARVEDILAELRPQARRLAAQAEQQATRTTAGEALAEGLMAAGHARWHEAAGAAATAGMRVERERAAASEAMARLQAAEGAAASVAEELAARAATEREGLASHETARTTLTELRLREARLASERESIERDLVRVAAERETAEASLVAQRRTLAIPVPARDLELEASLAEAERHLAEALAELGGLTATNRARGEEAAALRRAETARRAEAETAHRRLADVHRRFEAEVAAQRLATTRRENAERASATARRALEAAVSAATTAAADRESAAAAVADAEAARSRAVERSASAAATMAALQARLTALETRIRDEEERGIARAAKRVGGRRVDDDLSVDPPFRAAVEAALDELVRAYLVDRGKAAGLAGEQGLLVIREALEDRRGTIGDGPGRRFLERAAASGSMPLTDAIRRDPTGVASRALAEVVAAPDLPAALALQADLPAGWLVVVRDGSAVVGPLSVRLGRAEGLLERRAEAERLRTDSDRASVEAERAAAEATAAEEVATSARASLAAASARETQAMTARRSAEDAERAAARELEAAAREAGWHDAQSERLAQEVDRGREAVAAFETPSLWSGTADSAERDRSHAGDGEEDRTAIASWEARADELRARRDRLAESLAANEAGRREVEGRRAKAEATAAMDEERAGRAEREAAALTARQEAIADEQRRLGTDLGAAVEAERRAAAILADVRSADAAARDRLAAAERDASAAREALRAADDRLRSADRADLEARLSRDSLREQLLVELAGMGELGLEALRSVGGIEPVAVGPGKSEGLDLDREDAEDADVDDTTAAFEAALDAALARWLDRPPEIEPPGPGRLASLRRRYHELGAANPFAVEEYDDLRRRLESLETQQVDLRTAIDKTRGLIAELNTMIGEQFRTTFRALESAFDRTFQRLFGGGFARLSLTDPDDLSATGVEIVARPPGKKAQALAMLSGGERALTAVALLFAMLEVRPVPFCVLDEVDAALDEANVGRFSEALRTLADKTQFIVITHNRGTIEAADALYGVTVGDDSVSRVISLRLEEAQAIADRQRVEPPATSEDPEASLAGVG
jgi:chromosome segregation protein